MSESFPYIPYVEKGTFKLNRLVSTSDFYYDFKKYLKEKDTVMPWSSDEELLVFLYDCINNNFEKYNNECVFNEIEYRTFCDGSGDIKLTMNYCFEDENRNMYHSMFDLMRHRAFHNKDNYKLLIEYFLERNGEIKAKGEDVEAVVLCPYCHREMKVDRRTKSAVCDNCGTVIGW